MHSFVARKDQKGSHPWRWSIAGALQVCHGASIGIVQFYSVDIWNRGTSSVCADPSNRGAVLSRVELDEVHFVDRDERVIRQCGRM